VLTVLILITQALRSPDRVKFQSGNKRSLKQDHWNAQYVHYCLAILALENTTFQLRGASQTTTEFVRRPRVYLTLNKPKLGQLHHGIRSQRGHVVLAKPVRCISTRHVDMLLATTIP
jgi:hypothetical protein